MALDSRASVSLFVNEGVIERSPFASHGRNHPHTHTTEPAPCVEFEESPLPEGLRCSSK